MDNLEPRSERRKFKRINLGLTLTYQVEEPLSVRMELGWDKDIDAQILDLSEIGIAILTTYDIPVGAVLFLKFILINASLPSERHIGGIKIRGEVRSNIARSEHEHRLGILFSHVYKKEREAIATFIKILSLKKEP